MFENDSQLSGCGQPGCPYCCHVYPVFSRPSGLLPDSAAVVASPLLPDYFLQATPAPAVVSLGFPARVVTGTASLVERVTEVQVAVDMTGPGGGPSSFTLTQVITVRRVSVSIEQTAGLDLLEVAADFISSFGG